MAPRPQPTKLHDSLDQAFDRLQAMLPGKPSRALGWLHNPPSRYVRLPLGIFCVIGGFLWFLPVLGIEMLPIGVLLIAQDVPFLRKPVGKAMLPMLDGADRVMRKWKAWRGSGGKSS
jgi:hypothetical protein